MVDVSVIGCGNLGGAVIKGLSNAGTYSITACDLDEDALAAVEPYVTRTTTDISTALDASVVIVAVKPQNVSAILDDLTLGSNQTLLSFAAAVPTSLYEKHTDATVVRGMPNLAVETNMMACAVTEGGGEAVETILQGLGEYVVVDESLMDMATALNGSGPAFVFYLIKILRDAGIEGGFERDDAALLAAQTFKGAAETVLRTDESLDDLIDAVSSEGGTTIEGMEILWDSDVDEVFKDAVHAARDRSAEITAELDHE
ncbi:MAG: pyrroline-5-carboxylate reductase family protein [Halanaeroarchaeum sp.]